MVRAPRQVKTQLCLVVFLLTGFLLILAPRAEAACSQQQFGLDALAAVQDEKAFNGLQPNQIKQLRDCFGEVTFVQGSIFLFDLDALTHKLRICATEVITDSRNGPDPRNDIKDGRTAALTANLEQLEWSDSGCKVSFFYRAQGNVAITKINGIETTMWMKENLRRDINVTITLAYLIPSNADLIARLLFETPSVRDIGYLGDRGAVGHMDPDGEMYFFLLDALEIDASKICAQTGLRRYNDLDRQLGAEMAAYVWSDDAIYRQLVTTGLKPFDPILFAFAC